MKKLNQKVSIHKEQLVKKSNSDLAVIVIWPNQIALYNSKLDCPRYYFFRAKKHTLGDNLNIAVDNCHNEYFVRVDGDDWDSWATADKSIFYYECISALGGKSFNGLCPVYEVKKDEKDHFLYNAPQGAGIIWKTKIYKDLGGYDETLEFQADLDFYIKFVHKYKKMEFSSVNYIWNINPESQSKDRIKLLKHRDRVLKKHNLKDNEAPHFGAYFL